MSSLVLLYSNTLHLPVSDDMIENENETLRDRVGDLEKRVHDQNDEITCLRATLADCLRRINSLESTKSESFNTTKLPVNPCKTTFRKLNTV